MGKKCPDCPPKGLPMWMATFSDMNQLLMTFFILLLSMATFDETRIIQAFGVFSGSTGVLNQGKQPDVHPEEPIPRVILTPSTPKESESNVVKKIKTMMSQNENDNQISVVKTKEGLSIRILDTVLFKPESAEITEQAKLVLDNVASLVRGLEFSNINIEGRTDDQIPRTDLYKSNWELSSDRALNVLHYLVDSEKIDPEKLSTTAFSQYHPVVPNLNDHNRALNRRIEINIVSSEFSDVQDSPFSENGVRNLDATGP